MKMNLTIPEIQTYLYCPYQYKLRYVDGLDQEKEGSRAYKEAMHKAIYSFYYALLDGRILTPKQMKDKWASIWAEYRYSGEDLVQSLFEERQVLKYRSYEIDKRDYNMEGFKSLMDFHRKNNKNPGVPIAINHDYRVSIDGINVSGTFELVRELNDKDKQNRFIDIVDFRMGNEMSDPMLLQQDLHSTVASYAFRNLFQKKEDRMVLSFLKKGTEYEVHKTEEDYNRMKSIIKGVANGIERKEFYPRHTFLCKSCPVKEICQASKF